MSTTEYQVVRCDMAPIRHRRETKKLRASDIRKLAHDKDGPSQQVVWDADCPGLGLRLYVRKKEWVVRITPKGGKRSMCSIGRAAGAGALALSDARVLARVIVGRASAAESIMSMAITVAQLVEHYREHHRTKKKRRSPKGSPDFERRAQIICDSWGRRRIDKIRSAAVDELLQDFERRSSRKLGRVPTYESNRLRALISSMWNHAVRREFLPQNWVNPVRGTHAHREFRRPNAAPRDNELAKIIAKAEESDDEGLAVMVKLLAILGPRISELQQRTWDDVDFEGAVLTIRDPKNARDHHLPLVPYCAALLRSLPRVPGNRYVFAGAHGRPRSLRTISRKLRAIFTSAGFPDIQVKDLRASTATAIAEIVHPRAAQLLLNHFDSRTTDGYIRPSGDVLRDAVCARAEQVRNASDDSE